MKKFIKAQYTNKFSKEAEKKANDLATKLAQDAREFGVGVGKHENKDSPDELIVIIYVQGSTFKYCDGMRSELVNKFKKNGFKMQRDWISKGETF